LVRTAVRETSRFSRQESSEISFRIDMIARGLKYLDLASQSLRKLENELQLFLDEYYARVGHWFQQLEDLHVHPVPQENSAVAAATPLRQVYNEVSLEEDELASPLKDIDRELKQLYRKLVKRYHPDAVAPKPSELKESNVIQCINLAYADRSLSDLWQVEYETLLQTMEVHPIEDLMQILQERYERLVASIQRVVHYRKALMNSPAYALMKRHQQMKYMGEDLMESVIEEVKEQVRNARSTLVLKKLKVLTEA